MKGFKKNTANNKGAKSLSLNNKLSEDMVRDYRYRKIKSKIHLLYTILTIQDISIVKILEAYWAILHSLK
jgi:hypothetical protein